MLAAGSKLSCTYLEPYRETRAYYADPGISTLASQQRIDFKVLLLTYKALNNQAPLYLKELIEPYGPNRTLRSGAAGLLPITRIN